MVIGGEKDRFWSFVALKKNDLAFFVKIHVAILSTWIGDSTDCSAKASFTCQVYWMLIAFAFRGSSQKNRKVLWFWPCKLPKLWLNLILSRPTISHRDPLQIFCHRLCRRMTGEIVLLYDLVCYVVVIGYHNVCAFPTDVVDTIVVSSSGHKITLYRLLCWLS